MKILKVFFIIVFLFTTILKGDLFANGIYPLMAEALKACQEEGRLEEALETLKLLALDELIEKYVEELRQEMLKTDLDEAKIKELKDNITDLTLSKELITKKTSTEILDALGDFVINDKKSLDEFSRKLDLLYTYDADPVRDAMGLALQDICKVDIAPTYFPEGHVLAMVLADYYKDGSDRYLNELKDLIANYKEKELKISVETAEYLEVVIEAGKIDVVDGDFDKWTFSKAEGIELTLKQGKEIVKTFAEYRNKYSEIVDIEICGRTFAVSDILKADVSIKTTDYARFRDNVRQKARAVEILK